MKKYLIYMAAGSSRRFGTNKLLADLDGKALYRYGLELIHRVCSRRADCIPLVVSRYPEIREACLQRHMIYVDSPNSALGCSYTIHAAIRQIDQLSDGEAEPCYYIFFTADQPRLTDETMNRLIDAADHHPEAASVCFGDTPGNPTMFSFALREELLDLAGDSGGRKVLRKHSCLFVPADSAEELMDIDTPNDLPMIDKNHSM